MDTQEILRQAYVSPGVTNSVASLLKAVKSKGITRQQVQKFLDDQKPHQLQKKKKKDVYGGTVIPLDKGTYELDLADMSELSRSNNGVTFLLVVVDSLTKKADALPLKNKSAKEVAGVLSDFIIKTKPKGLVSDPGSEFTNKLVTDLLKKHNLPLRYVRVGSHAPNAERFIQNLKTMIYSYMEKLSSKKYINVLQKFIDTYNDNRNSKLHMSPNEMESRPGLARLAQKILAKQQFKRLPPIRIGAKVRKEVDKATFKKGYRDKWSRKIYTITKIRTGGEYTHDRYYINDWSDKWYRAFELQVVKDNPADEEDPEPVRKTRTQKEVEREVRELDGEVLPFKRGQRKPKGVEVYIDVPHRKRRL